MPYINFKNPADKIKSDWIQIKDKNKENKTKEILKENDVRGVFSKMKNESRVVSAGDVHEELTARGIAVSTDMTMTPNGVCCSSAGILIALDKEPNKNEVELIEDAIEAATNRPPKVDIPNVEPLEEGLV